MQETQDRELRWMRLDNAALIFPAAQRRRWSNAFRISFSFSDPVDPDVLQRAQPRGASLSLGSGAAAARGCSGTIS